MSMPEAAVDQNDSAITWEDNVRPAGQFWRMQSKPETCSVQATT